jgi:hypothetical protein
LQLVAAHGNGRVQINCLYSECVVTRARHLMLRILAAPQTNKLAQQTKTNSAHAHTNTLPHLDPRCMQSLQAGPDHYHILARLSRTAPYRTSARVFTTPPSVCPWTTHLIIDPFDSPTGRNYSRRVGPAPNSRRQAHRFTPEPHRLYLGFRTNSLILARIRVTCYVSPRGASAHVWQLAGPQRSEGCSAACDTVLSDS